MARSFRRVPAGKPNGGQFAPDPSLSTPPQIVPAAKPDVPVGASANTPKPDAVVAPSSTWDPSRLAASEPDPRLGVGRSTPEGWAPFLDGMTRRCSGPGKATRIAAAVLGGIAVALAPGLPAHATATPSGAYSADTRPCVSTPAGYQPVARTLVPIDAPASAALIDRVRDFASGALDGETGGGGIDGSGGSGGSMSIRMDPTLVESLREHARQRGVTVSRAVQDLVAAHLAQEENATSSSADATNDPASSAEAGEVRVHVQLDGATMSRAQRAATAGDKSLSALVREAVAQFPAHN